jgi:hypothetical protein
MGGFIQVMAIFTKKTIDTIIKIGGKGTLEHLKSNKFGVVGQRTNLQIDKEIEYLKELDKITSNKVRASYSLSKIKFEWTDEDVKEFCRIYTIGGYSDDYKDYKTIDEKMNRFKKLKR